MNMGLSRSWDRKPPSCGSAVKPLLLLAFIAVALAQPAQQSEGLLPAEGVSADPMPNSQPPQENGSSLADPVATRKLPSGKWAKRKIDWDAVEYELEKGDDPELLVTEDELLIAEMEKRRSTPPTPPVGVPLSDDLDWAKHVKATTGPTMVFAILKKYKPGSGSKEEWTDKDIEVLSWEWRELLKTAGVEATVYNLGSEEKPLSDKAGPKVLITLQQGWRGFEAKDFLLRQDSVLSVEWDNVLYDRSSTDHSNNNADKGGKNGKQGRQRKPPSSKTKRQAPPKPGKKGSKLDRKVAPSKGRGKPASRRPNAMKKKARAESSAPGSTKQTAPTADADSDSVLAAAAEAAAKAGSSVTVDIDDQGRIKPASPIAP